VQDDSARAAVSFSAGRRRTTWARVAVSFSAGRRRTTWARAAVSPSNSPYPGENRLFTLLFGFITIWFNT